MKKHVWVFLFVMLLVFPGCAEAPSFSYPEGETTQAILEGLTSEFKTHHISLQEVQQNADVAEQAETEPVPVEESTEAMISAPQTDEIHVAETVPTERIQDQAKAREPLKSAAEPSSRETEEPIVIEPTEKETSVEIQAPTEAPEPTVPPHVHDYKEKTVDPTCTSKGYTEHRCSCGDSYKDSYTAALGHNLKEQKFNATCTNGGYTLRTCALCGYSETANGSPALGHDYRDTVVAPTVSDEGYTEHICSRCGDSYRDSYTVKVKEVIDLQAVINYGNAYAQSLGFTVDRTMTLANSSYYPGYYGNGYSLDFLKQEAAGNVQYTYDSLIALGDTIPGYRCNIHAAYDSDADKYYIVFLYG